MWLFMCLCVGMLVLPNNGEVYTAMTDIGRLLTTEGEMIRAVENYIIAQESKLEKLRRDVYEMERVHDEAARSPEAFLGNPINTFLLVKRLTVDWTDLQNIMTDDSMGKAMLNNLTSMADFLHWPDEEDLNGVAVALMRLQDTYNLDTSQLARGHIYGKRQAYRELTAADCFELGRQSYNGGDHYHTMLWMNEALKRQEMESNKTVDHADILEYLAFSTYMQGNVRQALKLTNELLVERPNHQRAQGNKVYYEETLQAQLAKKRGEDGATMDEEAVEKGYTVTENAEVASDWQRERRAYERLCRGEGSVPHSISKKLDCFYKHGPSDFLRISPVKTEVVHIDPTVSIYYDILSDKEIAVIKELATPMFKRATVQNYKTGELETASYRISKSSWLKHGDHKVVAGVNHRIESITGLTMDTAEELQVANYGIGGHYEPHFDYARREEKDAFKSLGTGNRIATFLFYMSDVEAGGATVFPYINLSLWPKKGAAAFWYNLHPSGEGDTLTRHAACPVLVGTKWVSNKWIHERGQEFRRPCTLDYNTL
nr:prolyl 4-hydroxylase subunit alpha-1-like isoform X1 [Cherax quadricarinatus]XP_053628396.1 prolyl 4-hydroxylase subunit alpha-1-like isoform X1 [Cherax quadricarinatus]XP_053628397.1 prolyl 4-hydroxylase subunit alpha-1-like isoform X1 [Cherax quadricarinatus]XP_053628398.1 prolyl 4-hydroxylase subunit alpha-1-like isoform X1 [Cherax quadricarinatus]XP_053628399.1 prolyl 4-hydroxylase subunit alpha-1-like isoform X1 [Cherax quadricarinatus]XP_053628401.1 prolyl 4-hydroxylase subunit alpha-